MELSRIPRWCFSLLGLGLVAFGLSLHRPWERLAAERFVELGAIALLLAVCGGIAMWLMRGRAVPWMPGAAVVALMVFAGVPAVFATSLLVLAAVGLGSLLTREETSSGAIEFVLGAALIAATLGWLLPFPVHSPWLYCLVLLGIVVWRRVAILAILRKVRHGLDAQGREAPFAATAFMVLLVVATMPGWLPAMMSDDLALHLGLWKQLSEFGLARFDARTQVWALAPWAGDVLHTVPALIAGAEAHGPVNAVFVAVTCGLVWQLARAMGAGVSVAWWSASVYASLPMTGALTAGMQTELPTAMMVAALALCVKRAPNDPDAGTLHRVALLAGFALALKASNIVFIAPLGVWLLLRWRGALPWAALPKGLAIGVLAGGSSYAYAWLLTGNPVLPLFNGVFGSDFFAQENFRDLNWATGLGWDLPWRLTFQTSGYFEGFDGAAGFVLVALAGGFLLALVDPRSRAVALCGLAGMGTMLVLIQYLRYLHPGMPLLIPAALTALAGAPGTLSWTRLLAFSLAVLQMLFLPAASWMVSGGAIRVLAREGREAVLRQFAPHRLLVEQQAARLGPADRVLFIDGAMPLALLPGRAMIANWYDSDIAPWLFGTVESWERILDLSGASHVVARQDRLDEALTEVLRGRGFEEVARVGDVRMLELGQAPLPGGAVQAGERRVQLSYPLPGGTPKLADIRLTADCAAAGDVYALAGAVERDGGRNEANRFAWVGCGPDARLDVRMQARLSGRAHRLVVSLEPVQLAAKQEGSGLTGVRHSVVIRNDLLAKRWATRGIMRATCRLRGCRGQAAPGMLWLLDRQ
jgi:hypothetical protein